MHGDLRPSTQLPGGAAEPIPREDIFDVLSNERRRCVLQYLKRQDGRRVELRELVDHVAAWENDTTPDAVGTDERKRVYTALRQAHLPKMEQAGILEYEPMRSEVELTEDASQVQLYLEYVPNRDIPWSDYYLGLSFVGAALVTVVWAGIYPFDGLSGVVLAAIIVAVLAVSGAVHRYETAKHRIGSDQYEVHE